MHIPTVVQRREGYGALVAALLLFSSASLFAVEPADLTLAHANQPSLPIVIATAASAPTKQLAADLASALQHITGATFKIETADAPHGIVLGTDAEWPGLLAPVSDGRPAVLSREDYLLRTDTTRFLIIGRTALGEQDAVWGFLQEIGFRQFFPGPDWEIWPSKPDLAVHFDEQAAPSYNVRKIGFGVGPWPEDHASLYQWMVRNRMVSGFDLRTGHSYGAIIKSDPAHFAANPGDIVNPASANAKLDPSRQTVRDAALAYALAQLKSAPDTVSIDPGLSSASPDSVSIEPSDGGGWRTDSPLGRPSNQAVTLSNYVAHGIQAQFPGRKVGMYAYNQHSTPPDIAVDPNVIVSVATSFIHGGFTAEALIKGWHAKGAEIGIREYLSVWPWDEDLPGKARATDVAYLTDTISRFHDLGARYWISEAGTGWGPHGLGYYLTTRFLWDVNETKKSQELTDDFYRTAFGPAQDEMRTFYQQDILASGHPLLSEDLVGHMYRTLSAALDKAGTPEIKRRILDLVIYTRYVELMSHYLDAKGKARQEAYNQVAQFTYQARSAHMVNSRDLFRSTPTRDKQLRPVDYQGHDPLMVETPISDAELMALVPAGIAANPIANFSPVSFSQNLVPFSTPGSGAAGTQADGAQTVEVRGTSSLYFYLPDNGSLSVTVRGGLISPRGGPVHLRLFSDLNPIVDEPVASSDAPNDLQNHEVALKSPYKGLHRLEIADGGGATEVSWPSGTCAVVPVSPETTTRLTAPYSLSFEVPAGTKVVGGYAKVSKGTMQGPDGSIALNFAQSKAGAYFSVPVANGTTTTVWKLSDVDGEVLLLTVPPYLSRTPAELLVPKETLTP